MPPTSRRAQPDPKDLDETHVGITSAADGVTYPDLTAQLVEYLSRGQTTVAASPYSIVRRAESLFRVDRAIGAVEGWARRDETLTAYLVRVERGPADISRSHCVGAARIP